MSAVDAIISEVHALEKELSDEKKKSTIFQEEMKTLQETLKTSQQQVKDLLVSIETTESTLAAQEQFFNDYKEREGDTWTVIQRMIMQYMEDHELYQGSVNDNQGRLIRSFKGLTKEQKEQHKDFIKFKIQEIEDHAMILREAKV